tara:strand:- start:712 stop:1476 length:765 start_codon:yes stop_codon:yes gene_type:complete
MKTLNKFLEQAQPTTETEKEDSNSKKEDSKIKQAQSKENQLKKRVLMTKIRAVRGGATGIMASHEPEGEVVEGLMTMLGKKKKEKKAEKAMDAGARAKRKLARKVHAKYVSGSEDNVPDDIREAKVDAGKSPEQKEKDRNVRKFGVSHNVAGHGKLRRALHRSDRGDKKIKGDKSQYVEMEGTDKAYEYVVSKLKKKYGDGVLTKGDKIKPKTAAQKKAAAAHQAKVDRENAAERAKDPSQGRYPPGYSNRGSD